MKRNSLIHIFFFFLSITLFSFLSLNFFTTTAHAWPGDPCTSDADCPPYQGYNYCCGNNVCNDSYNGLCNNGWVGQPGLCDYSFGSQLSHVDTCGCGCTGGACNSCAPSSTCDGSTYPQLCNGGTGVQTCNGKNNTYDPGCNPNCSACQSKWSCSGSSCVADGSGGYTDSNCSGACAPPPAGCDQTQCTGWGNGGCGAGGCAANQRQQTRSCPGGSTCSTSQCVNDGSCGGGGCGSVNLSVTPNPVVLGNKITITASSAPSGYSDSFTGGFSNCDAGATSTYAVCTTNATGTFTWTRNWPGGCSTSVYYTINNVSAPPTPSISAPSCIPNGYNGSGVTISWGATNPPVTWADISTDSNFGTFSNRPVSGTSTTGPSGFSNGLTLNPNTTYYVRTWNGSQHSPTTSFSINGPCTSTYNVVSGAVCTNGTTPYGRTRFQYNIWNGSTNFDKSFSTDAYAVGTHTLNNLQAPILNSIFTEPFIGLQTENGGIWLEPAPPNPNPSYVTYGHYGSSASNWMASWSAGAGAPSGTYNINYYAPASMCQVPTITGIPIPACFDGSTFSISWNSMDPAVSYVDISTDNFGTYYNKQVSGTSTTVPIGTPTGFTGAQGQGALTLTPNTPYYVRLWNGYLHSSTVTFNIPICAPIGLFALCPAPGNQATLTWGATLGANGYSVTVPTVNGGLPVSASSPYIFTSIPGNTYNSWTVQACYNNNCGPATTTGSPFTCVFAPWIQTSGGDVHSNTGINAPGGP